MKTTLPLLILIAALISIASGRQTESITDADTTAKSIIEASDSLIWSSLQPALDSMIGCDRVGSRTRYFSSFYIDFVTEFPGDGGQGDEDSTWVLSFTMEVQLPGEFCADTIPMTFLAESLAGDSIPIFARPVALEIKSASVPLKIDVELILPIHLDGTLNGGGLAIIVETIDPVTAFTPKLTRVSDWVAEVGDETFEMLAEEGKAFPQGQNPPQPEPPSCEVCLPHGDAALR